MTPLNTRVTSAEIHLHLFSCIARPSRVLCTTFSYQTCTSHTVTLMSPDSQKILPQGCQHPQPCHLHLGLVLQKRAPITMFNSTQQCQPRMWWLLSWPWTS